MENVTTETVTTITDILTDILGESPNPEITYITACVILVILFLLLCRVIASLFSIR